MSLPPQTTVVFDNIPEGWLVGIDFHYFNSTSVFRGIKLIPEGFHVVHWGATPDSVREALVFMGKGNMVILARWNKESEVMELETNGMISELDVSAMKSRLGEQYQFMVPFPTQDNSQNESFLQITGHITQELVDRMPEPVSSTSTSKEENELLRKSLTESAQLRADKYETKLQDDELLKPILDKDEDELGFTQIEAQTWPDGATGSEITKHSLDKSWYLNHWIRRSSFDRLFLGELELSFVLTVVLANFSASQHWLKQVELYLGCIDDVDEHPARCQKFFSVISAQIKCCPPEYIDTMLEPHRLRRAFIEFSHHHPIPAQLVDQLATAGIVLELEGDDIDEDPVVV